MGLLLGSPIAKMLPLLSLEMAVYSDPVHTDWHKVSENPTRCLGRPPPTTSPFLQPGNKLLLPLCGSLWTQGWIMKLGHQTSLTARDG